MRRYYSFESYDTSDVYVKVLQKAIEEKLVHFASVPFTIHGGSVDYIVMSDIPINWDHVLSDFDSEEELPWMNGITV